MDECLCSTVRQLASDFDEQQARDLIPALNAHLSNLQTLLAQLRGLGLTRDVKYTITVSNQRTVKALSVESVNLGPVDRVCDKFRDDVEGFWEPSDDTVQTDLRRRIACAVIFLRSRLDVSASVPPQVVSAFQGPQNYVDLRHAGRKYLKIARKLGGIGALFWLPLDIPHSTYERYLNMDDEVIFDHFASLHPQADKYSDIVTRLILDIVKKDTASTCSYYNLITEHGDLLPSSDHISLLLYALGGHNIPDVLLKSALLPQRRWNVDGEIETTTSATFGLPDEIIRIFANEKILDQALIKGPSIVMNSLQDGLVGWSLHPPYESSIAEALTPDVKADLGIVALKLICFTCPPCYLGDTDWSAPSKEVIWPVIDRTIKAYKAPQALKAQLLEAVLYFCERDDIAIRRLAIEQCRSLLRKSMPYFLHASVAVFQSILHRVDGDVAKSEAVIRDFLWKGPKPETRRDNALRGRLHIAQIDNKIKCADDDVPQLIYNWKAEHPLSSLDVEVTSRLQSAAARFFQSIGDYEAAIESLEQFLSLHGAKPIRPNSRRLLVARLADMYCEMQGFARTLEVLAPELDDVSESDRRRRPYRRLNLSIVEAKVGLGEIDVAISVLQAIGSLFPEEPDNVHDQQLHMRKAIVEARIAHMISPAEEAVRLWKLALEEVERMYTIKDKEGFCAAIVYLSLAHAQLTEGDREGARHSWATGAEILQTEKCEFWIPIASTAWLHRVITEVHQMQGWSLRMMLPGGRPDMVWS